VSLDALALALASVVRPMSVAAVYAMLSAARPTRLLTAYIVAGFAFSAGIDIVVVILLGLLAGRRPRTRRVRSSRSSSVRSRSVTPPGCSADWSKDWC